MPRVSGVSGSSTVWRIFRNPIPRTVSNWVRLKPIVLLTSVTFSSLAAGFFALFLAMSLSALLIHDARRILRSDELTLFLAPIPGHEGRILQVHQAGKRRPHHV